MAAVTVSDIDRAYFYSRVCGGDLEKARKYNNYDEVDWEFYRFTYEYCREILGKHYDYIVEDVMSDLKP